MPHLAGRWAPPTLEGDRVVHVDGRAFHVPAESIVRRVNAHHRIGILHVKVGSRAYVLSAMGQLVEDDSAARTRAAQFSLVAGDVV